ncbi:MAG: hypothetical protein JXB34_15480 [Bacteroidales bacterium]|nr:hypothetical protein [Bacteroidales bacterium]
MEKPFAHLLKPLLAVSVFAVSMGFLESAVVVYLREIYYPTGFAFPLTPLAPHIASTELFRELATLVMLLGIGYFAGHNFSTRFAWFIYTFALWDIFYYIFLKLLLNWPETLFTFDILFLVPTAWFGPVIAPVIVSISMIMLALAVVTKDFRNEPAAPDKTEWAMLISGSVVLILAFVWDFSRFFLEKYPWQKLFFLPGNNLLFRSVQDFVPCNFNWPLFIMAQGVIFLAIARYLYRK